MKHVRTDKGEGGGGSVMPQNFFVWTLNGCKSTANCKPCRND